jgi:hypothetical protein
MRRVLIYAVIYGAIGALVGACVALYTRDLEVMPKNIVLSNGSAAKVGSKHSSPSTAQTEVAESPTPITSTTEETN